MSRPRTFLQIGRHVFYDRQAEWIVIGFIGAVDVVLAWAAWSMLA